MKSQIINLIEKAVEKFNIEKLSPIVSLSESQDHGDYTTNIAMVLSKKLGRGPMDIAEEIVEELRSQDIGSKIEKVEAAKPGFINFWISKEELMSFTGSDKSKVSESRIISSTLLEKCIR